MGSYVGERLRLFAAQHGVLWKQDAALPGDREAPGVGGPRWGGCTGE